MIRSLFTVSEILLMVFVNHNHGLSYTKRNPEEEGNLIFASILYRHGERNPDGFYPNDPYKHPSYWPEGLGTLTKKGKNQHYSLGKWLRKRYSSLIPGGKYTQDLLYVRSTDVGRTIESARANLAGLFYPNLGEELRELPNQNIPIHTVPMNLDKVLLITQPTQPPCLKTALEDEAVRDSKAMRDHMSKRESFYNYLSEHTGDVVRNPRKARSIFTTLFLESVTIKNFTIPGWATKVYPGELQQVGALSMSMLTMTKTLKRLRGGPLLKEIIQHMKDKRAGRLTQNLWMYSGHDVTVTCLLDTMGVFQPHLPPFTSTVLVELRENINEEFLVSVHYKNSTEESHLFTIPGCRPLCPLDTFEELLEDVIPEDWETECENLEPTIPTSTET